MNWKSWAAPCAAVLLALAAAAPAATKSKKMKYVPPTGLFGHKWGELRSDFDKLPDRPLAITAAWMKPVVTGVEVDCMGGNDCSDFTMMNLWTKHEGGGFYVLSEYSIETQALRYSPNDELELYPVIHQFCANWKSVKREEPPNFRQINRYCGAKLMFESETEEQLKTLPRNYVTNYDRVLDKLMLKYGRPEGYSRRGQVYIETLEGEDVAGGTAADRKFKRWRWCPAKGLDLAPDCTASIVLSLDLDSGIGTVLYSTPLLWEYAYARHTNGFRKDPLYMMLRAVR
jgi:hypothetical protein